MSQSEETARTAVGWERHELGVGLALIGLGILAVVLGWRSATAAEDVGGQLRALILGGCGGICLVTVGAGLMQAHVAARTSRETASKLDRCAEALLDLAAAESPARPPLPDSAYQPHADTSVLPTVGGVVMSKSTYHDPSCRLVTALDELESAAAEEAEAQGLRPCGICRPASTTRPVG